MKSSIDGDTTESPWTCISMGEVGMPSRHPPQLGGRQGAVSRIVTPIRPCPTNRRTIPTRPAIFHCRGRFVALIWRKLEKKSLGLQNGSAGTFQFAEFGRFLSTDAQLIYGIAIRRTPTETDDYLAFRSNRSLSGVSLPSSESPQFRSKLPGGQTLLSYSQTTQSMSPHSLGSQGGLRQRRSKHQEFDHDNRNDEADDGDDVRRSEERRVGKECRS